MAATGVLAGAGQLLQAPKPSLFQPGDDWKHWLPFLTGPHMRSACAGISMAASAIIAAAESTRLRIETSQLLDIMIAI